MVQIQHRDLLRHVDKARNAGGELRKHGGPGSALHTAVQILHEQNVKDHVHDRRSDQKVQRRAAVAQGAQHGGAQIVKHGRADAHEDDENIAVRVVKDLRRGVHQPQQIIGPEKADQADDRRDAEAQPHKLRRAPADTLQIPGAEALGNGDGETGTAAGRKAEDQKAQGTRGADRRKGVQAEDAADQDAVGQIIKLLKQVSDQKRHAKAQDALQRRTRGHVSCHFHSTFHTIS